MIFTRFASQRALSAPLGAQGTALRVGVTRLLGRPQAVCCYERATTSLKKLLDDNDFSSSRAKLVRDQYEQMSREGDAVLDTLKKDHYLVLMLDRGCGSSAVKKAYRQMALKYHPGATPRPPRAGPALKPPPPPPQTRAARPQSCSRSSRRRTRP